MKTEKKVLISGASVAGTALAFWLQKDGYSIMVIERSKVFRTGGQNVDIEGPGQEVIKLMGLEEKVEEMNTREKGVQLLNDSGKVIASLPKGAAGSLTSSYEILRGDLAHIMYDETKEHCDYRFGITITDIHQNDSTVFVTFSDGTKDEFDFVFCTEGVSSNTRRMVMDENIRYKYIGLYAAYFRIPRRAEDGDWASIYNGKGGSFILVRPVYNRDTTVLVNFRRKQFDTRDIELSEQKRMLREALAGAGGLANRVLEDLDYDQDFYLGPYSQIIASTWSKGRFILLGDAAYCPSALTGQGTPLSLTGAYVLAGELRKNQTYTEAIQEYEKIMRPYVDSGRTFFVNWLRYLYPKSSVGIFIMRSIAVFLTSKLMQRIFRLFGGGNDTSSYGGFVLPKYF